jgi:uncharacterized repeat protein (TIGR01451 family)
MTRTSAAAFLALCLSLAASGQSPGPVETRLEQAKVARAADGQESLVPADAPKPGDVIQYTATYRNTGPQGVRNLEATLPIPPQTELVASSDRPAGARASTDGKTFGAMPLKRKKLVQGKEVEETVPLREVRFLRWSAPELAAGQSAAFSARVRIVDNRPPSGGGGRP